MKRAGWFAFVILFGLQSQAATILTTGDVWIAGDTATNQGGSPTLEVNNSFGGIASLIQFDLSAFAGQTVTGPGTFTVFVHGGPGVIDGAVALHRMLHSWSESIATFANLGPTPGFQAGEDFDPVILSTFGGSIGCCNLPVDFAVDASVIQAWIDNPGTNFGFILEPNTATSVGVEFLSREGGAPATLTFNSVASGAPEPVTAWLAICGLGMIGLQRLRRS